MGIDRATTTNTLKVWNPGANALSGLSKHRFDLQKPCYLEKSRKPVERIHVRRCSQATVAAHRVKFQALPHRDTNPLPETIYNDNRLKIQL